LKLINGSEKSMRDISTKDLVQQGLTAARVGDLDDARRLLTQATEQAPNSVAAWLGLAGVVDSLEEKKQCFDRVLALDPDNAEAQAGLALVERKLAEFSPAANDAETGMLHCYRHPGVETGLRCNRCGKPICPKCARRTQVGFRCPDCIREQEDKFYTGTNTDYIVAVVIALPLSLIMAGLFIYILGMIPLWGWIIGFLVAPAVAGFIAEAVRRGVGKRRSRYLGWVVAACLVLGALPIALFYFFLIGGGLILSGIFIFFGATTILARLR
jgi:hypothetical protein